MHALLTILFIMLTTTAFSDSAGSPKFDRKSYRHWIDEDRDCQNARHEGLIEESLLRLGSSLQKAAKWSQEAGMAGILAEPLPMPPSWILITWFLSRRHTSLVLPTG